MASGELLAELAGQLLGQRAVVEVAVRPARWPSWSGSPAGPPAPRAGDMPKSTWFRMICRIGRDDRGSAGRADAEDRLPVPERDDRAHAGPRLLAAGGQVRVVGPGRGRREVEVGHLVVEQEAVAGHGLAAAAEEVDGVGVGDDVAPLVGGDDVVGVAALRRRGCGVAAGCGAAPVTAGTGCPGATGEVSAWLWIRQRRVAANAGLSSPDSGTLT